MQTAPSATSSAHSTVFRQLLKIIPRIRGIRQVITTFISAYTVDRAEADCYDRANANYRLGRDAMQLAVMHFNSGETCPSIAKVKE
jgi:hypothetical protein